MERIHDIYRPVDERKHDFKEVERRLTLEDIKPQLKRCQNCGVPFCHGAGCPLGNLVPDENRAMSKGDVRRAYELLSVHSDFPEFTSRICPALCESCCVRDLDEEPVMIRQSEKLIIDTAFERGWVVPEPPEKENGKRAAVIGAGPAGPPRAPCAAKAGRSPSTKRTPTSADSCATASRTSSSTRRSSPAAASCWRRKASAS